jgi:threonine dehydrogenase-like Zn-dependent dehydrogenase
VRVCALDGPALVREVGELSGGRLADCVIEAVGSQQALDRAGELTRVRGRLVIAGYHQDGPRLVNLQLWNWRGLDVVNAHERDRALYVEGMRQALSLAANGTIPLDQLITHTLPLEELDRAFQLMAGRPSGFLKSVVVC